MVKLRDYPHCAPVKRQNMARILFIEDDEDIRPLIEDLLLK